MEGSTMSQMLSAELMEQVAALDNYKPTPTELEREKSRFATFSNGEIAWYGMAQDSEQQSEDGGVIISPSPTSLLESWLLMWHEFPHYMYRQRGYKDYDLGRYVKITRMPFGPDYQHRQDPVKAALYYANEKKGLDGEVVSWRIVESAGPPANPRSLLWMKPSLREGIVRVPVPMQKYMAPLPADWQRVNIIARRKMAMIKASRALNSDQREEIRQLVSSSIAEVLKALKVNVSNK